MNTIVNIMPQIDANLWSSITADTQLTGYSFDEVDKEQSIIASFYLSGCEWRHGQPPLGGDYVTKYVFFIVFNNCATVKVDEKIV